MQRIRFEHARSVDRSDADLSRRVRRDDRARRTCREGAPLGWVARRETFEGAHQHHAGAAAAMICENQSRRVPVAVPETEISHSQPPRRLT